MGFKKPLIRTDGALLTARIQSNDDQSITSIDVGVPTDASDAVESAITDETLKLAVGERPDLKGLKSFSERHYDTAWPKWKVLRLYFSNKPDAQMPDDDLD